MFPLLQLDAATSKTISAFGSMRMLEAESG
jgi:hypothetical protein